MKSRLPSDIDLRRGALGLTIAAVAAAIMFAAQIALAGFANIELVSLLVMLFTLCLKRRVLYSIYVFVLLEGLVYGFHLWWVMYLYVWTILAGVTWFFRKTRSALVWAVISGLFGLMFGALCSIPYFFVGGFTMAAAYWVSGIPFDLAHCAGNFLLCLILWRPLCKALERIGLMQAEPSDA